MIVELRANISDTGGRVVAVRVIEYALDAVPRFGELVIVQTGDELDVVRVMHKLGDERGAHVVVELEAFSDVADALVSDLEKHRWRDPSSS